jgi:hypothetical protein
MSRVPVPGTRTGPGRTSDGMVAEPSHVAWRVEATR